MKVTDNFVIGAQYRAWHTENSRPQSVMLATWLNKMFLICNPPQKTTIWLLFTDKSTFVRAVVSRPIYQETQEESHSSMHQAIVIKTLVSSVDSAVANEPATAPLSSDPRVPGEHCLRKSPMDERVLWKYRFPAENFQHTIGEKIQVWMHLRGLLNYKLHSWEGRSWKSGILDTWRSLKGLGSYYLPCRLHQEPCQ